MQMNTATQPTAAPFVVSKAAAGSGKTFSLVLEYLKLALAGPREGIDTRFRGILAVTFTNKAVNEMKSRIMKELDRMVTHGIDPSDQGTMGGRLFAELSAMDYYSRNPLTPDLLQQMAEQLQTAILHHYTDLSVVTIDSFMLRIVRTFAHDIGQPVGFDIMIEKQKLIDEAVEQLMLLVGTEGNEELTSLLMAYADSNMDNDRGYNVENDIKKLARLLFDEDVEPRLKKLSALTLNDFRTIHRRYSEANREVERKLRAIGDEMMRLLDGTGLTDADCYQTGKGFLSYFRKLSEGVMAAPNSYVTGSMTGGKLVSAKCDRALAERLESLRPEMEAIYARVEDFFQHDIVDYNTRAIITANLYSTALLGHLYRLFGTYFRDNQVIHLSESNRMINSIVEDEDNPAPFIFERLGNRYRHFLIDEFQDTSVMQWHNLVPLVENGVSQDKESFVVGDAKQAIYRFRKGDVRQFVRLPKVDGMRHHGGTLGMPGNSRVSLLDTNYRTAASVVDFNNDFFSWLLRNRFADNELAMDIFVGRDADGNLRAEGEEELRQRKSTALEGHVSACFIDAKESEWVYEEVLNTIQMLVGERGYSYGDIMVLARDNKQLAALSGYITANSAVPQTSDQSFLLTNSDAAMAIVAALRYLNDRRDRVAVADLLQRLANLGVIASTHSEELTGRGPIDLPQLLRSEGRGIDFRPAYLLSLDLYDCCEELVRQLHLDGVDIPYVGKLLDAAAAFSARHRQQLGDFLTWFDEQKDLSATTSEQLDAVRLLTVHAAKGLEAPVVIYMVLPPAVHNLQMWIDIEPEEGGEKPQLPTAYVRFSKDNATRYDAQRGQESAMNAVDELNVLYVAMTRPREQLYLVCQKAALGNAPLLFDYLEQSLDEDGRVHFGDPDWRKQEAGKAGKKGKDVVALQSLSFADWTSKVSIASPSEKAVTPLLEDKVRFGIYAHDLLSGILHASDVDDALARFRAANDVEEMDVLEALARRVVSDPATARFFADGTRVANEVSLLDGGEMGRPDRVVFADGQTWVVDFKTGSPVPQNVAQVRSYCRTIAAMGYPEVKGYLIYLHPDGLEVVPVDGE